MSRGLIAGLFDGPGGAAALRRIDSVEIRCVAPFADRPPRMVAWLAAWLAGQLGWRPLRREVPRPGEILAAFQGPAGEVAVRLEPPQVLSWLRGLTDMRLALAARLGIVDTDDVEPEDETGQAIRAVYDWLGSVQDGLVRAIDV